MPKSKITFEYAYPRAVKYLSIRPRSVKEMNDYLEKKQIPSDVSQRVTDELLKDNFLNDREFCKWWIRGRQNRGKASFLIKCELQMKGVDSDIIDEELSGEAQDDISVAREVVDKYHKRYAKYTGREYYQKMGAFLARRGFSYDVIRKVLSRS